MLVQAVRPISCATDDPWMVWRTRKPLLLLEMLEREAGLEGWTPIEEPLEEDGQRRAMLPGLCFAPERLRLTIEARALRWLIFDLSHVLYNGSLMLLDEAHLEGLRRAEESANSPWLAQNTILPDLRLGMHVRIVNHSVIGLSGIITRLEAERAHLDIEGMPGKVVIPRRSLEVIE